MTLFKYTMITLLIIVTIFITREITIYTYKCPGKPVFKFKGKPFLQTSLKLPKVTFGKVSTLIVCTKLSAQPFASTSKNCTESIPVWFE